METPSFIVQGNILPSRFVMAYTSQDNTVQQATLNAPVMGISQEFGREPPLPTVSTEYAGITGDSMMVYGEGKTCLLELGDIVVAGSYLKADSTGRGIPALTTGPVQQFTGAFCAVAGVVGDLVRVQVLIGNTYPALS